MDKIKKPISGLCAELLDAQLQLLTGRVVEDFYIRAYYKEVELYRINLILNRKGNTLLRIHDNPDADIHYTVRHSQDGSMFEFDFLLKNIFDYSITPNSDGTTTVGIYVRVD